MNNLDLSIVILSYNTKEITSYCLLKLEQSIKHCKERLGNEIEVIVLDNASIDGSYEEIKDKYPWVNLIKSNVNTGYAKGNNILLNKTSFPYVLLLNSDCYVREDTLVGALTYLKNNPNVDLFGCKLVYPDGKFQPSGGYLPCLSNIIFWILGLSLIPLTYFFVKPFHPKIPNFFSKEKNLDWVMGAFMMGKYAVFKDTKGFDEHFFMHMEEIELCKRILNSGFQIWYNPNLEVTHIHGASTSEVKTPFLNEFRGLKYYFKKHHPKEYFVLKPFLMFGLIFRIIIFSLLGNSRRAKVYMEGLSVI